MKTKFGYLSSLLLLALIIVASTWGFKKHSPEAEKPFRIAYAFHPEQLHLDPKKIEWSYEYDLVNNLFGRLLRADQNNHLTTDLPESMTLSDRSVVFVFGNKSATSSGHIMDARDAETSLKRLLVGDHPKFSWVKKILCVNFNFQNVSSPCAGIRREGSSLRLTVQRKSELPLLLSALSSPDFGISPFDEIDLKTGDLLANFLSDTSGPYSVASTGSDGELEFVVNKNSHLYSTQMVPRIEIIPSSSAVSIQKYIDGKLELLPMDTFWGSDAANDVLNDPRNHIYESLPIRVSFVKFNRTGLSDFTIPERMYLGNKIAEANRQLHPQPGAKVTTQFLQSLSDGALPKEMETELKRARETKLGAPPKRVLKFGITQKDFSKMREILKNVPEIEVVSYPTHPSASAETDWPDAMTMVADISSNDIMSMVTSYLDSELYVPGLDAKKWLATFVSSPDRQSRSQLVRSLHGDALRNASIIPNVVAPYFAATRKNIEFDANKLQPTMDMWTIRRK